ncbi:hypothetical protein AMECASPLE_029911 [Ameca splendens]|uniref:Uncharacterized protein n=1 Tax=Ameca splendens TaxID=208324 RepID=A0ABV0YTE9_9TELE
MAEDGGQLSRRAPPCLRKRQLIGWKKVQLFSITTYPGSTSTHCQIFSDATQLRLSFSPRLMLPSFISLFSSH